MARSGAVERGAVERGAVGKVVEWAKRPDVFVREVFGAEPDLWQGEVLRDFPGCKRQSMVAAKGPGKTTTLAWAIWNYMVTRPHPNIMATSSSEFNLNDGLWKELAKWMSCSPMLGSTFELTKTRLFNKAHPETWFCSKRLWSKSANSQQQSETLAGFHADYVMAVMDEVSGIPDGVTSSAEAVLSSGKEQHVLIAGNPTKLEGLLYASTTSQKHLWKVYHISNDPEDPKRSTRASLEYARQMIAQHGREDAFVLVNVLGRFPPHSLDTLIGPDEMRAAEGRQWGELQLEGAARVLGVDVARFGDDASVLFPRQGLVLFTPSEWRNLDSVQGAGHVARKIGDWGADACFIDNTGGHGAGWIDQLRLLGYSPIPVTFNGSASDARYYNKRSEMYCLFAQWIKDGGQIPECPPLVRAMTQTMYTFKGDRKILEDKEDVKARLGFSPDHADAAAETFAQPVMARALARRNERRGRYFSSYNPYAIDPSEYPRTRW